MRWVAVAVAAGVVAGCAEKSATTESSPRPASDPADTRPAAPPTSGALSRKRVADDRPAAFDPSDADRTLRWLVELTERARRPELSRRQATERWEAVKKALAACPGKTFEWKLPVAAANAEGLLSIDPLRTDEFAGRSEKHPHITLGIRAWNGSGVDAMFKWRPESWLANLRPGQDEVTVRGQITAINTADQYAWYVSLYDVRFTPGTDAAASPKEKEQPPEEFDPDDPARSFAALRRQFYHVADPFAARPEQEKRKNRLASQFRSLAGKRVRWRWPTTVAADGRLTLEPLIEYDYPFQLRTAMGVLVQRFRPPGKKGAPAAPAGDEPDSDHPASPTAKLSDPDLTGKLRTVNKATVSGKVTRVSAADGGVFPPRALEIAVWLDDVVIEP